jgi:transposase
MPGERLSMRKIREVLRLRLGQGLPQRAVAQSLRLSQGAVHGSIARARRAGWVGHCLRGSTTSSSRPFCSPHRPRWRLSDGRRRIGRWRTVSRGGRI